MCFSRFIDDSDFSYRVTDAHCPLVVASHTNIKEVRETLARLVIDSGMGPEHRGDQKVFNETVFQTLDDRIKLVQDTVFLKAKASMVRNVT